MRYPRLLGIGLAMSFGSWVTACTIQDVAGNAAASGGDSGAGLPGSGGSAPTGLGGSGGLIEANGGSGGLTEANGGAGQDLSTFTNPSGSCGVHYLDVYSGYPGDTPWLPDCQLPLRRAYWRVLLNSDGTGTPTPFSPDDRRVVAACDDSTAPVHALLDRYGWCTNTGDSTDRMDPADALALTHYLHQVLTFTASGVALDPPQDGKDVLDICLAYPEARSGVLAAVCQAFLLWHQPGSLFPGGLSYTAEQATELARYLNQLYGIGGAAPPSITCTSPSFPSSPRDLPQCAQLCPGGGVPGGACTEMSLTCNYYPGGGECALCTCGEELTNGVPSLSWQCAVCLT